MVKRGLVRDYLTQRSKKKTSRKDSVERDLMQLAKLKFDDFTHFERQQPFQK